MSEITDKLMNWLRVLALERAPSGIEHFRREKIIEIIQNDLKLNDLEIDRMGNLVFRINKEINQPKIIIFSHMDEIGATVRKITKDGKILISKRGGIDHNWLISRRIKILNNKGEWINGLIPGKALHSIPSAKRNDPNLDLFKLKLYVGVESKEEVEKLGIHVGAPVIVEEKLDYLNPEFDKDTILGHSLDNLVAIVHNLYLIKKLKEYDFDKIKAQIIFAFTVQEEIGCVGSRFVAKCEEPDITLAIDVGIVEDSSDAIESGSTLRGGPMIVWQEAGGSHIFDYELCKELTDIAEKAGIQYQNSIFQFYGSESGKAQIEFGVPSALIGIPTMSTHNAPEISTLSGIEQAIDLTYNWIQNKFV